MAGVYLHIPFCKQACHYCDFHFSTSEGLRHEMVRAMIREIELRQKFLEGRPVSSIYFGGGTPSLLTSDHLIALLNAVRNSHAVTRDAEITLEANPDDLDVKKISALRAAGVNRLSIGIQSFDDEILKFLNRAHDSTTARRCVLSAKREGFVNMSLDLIYAIPGLTRQNWRESIEQTLELEPMHVSAYALTIEPRTAFGTWLSRGKFEVVSDEQAAEQSELLTTMLDRSGIEQYEVSNYAKPGWESRHNSSYWKQEPYLGIGPSAHSYNLHSRQFNVRNNHLYVRSLEAGVIPSELETLTPADQANEYLLTTLRTKWGSDLERLRNEYHYDLLARHERLVNTLIQQNLATLDNHILALTRTGRLLADKITSDLFLVSGTV